ncbi:hypothetical protein HXX76_006342 [Chlamydomonas incerta]|uniref:Uncharacterized protein n=1 Tax=Chlamydomonas incerta TaxID=51695 RepID=A0A835TFF3_CHLIN|nr:hypothetical protein HXX76_006342 [Chlamydomonas incerta]|eukprot:KAG2436820.1 hypothetical protein HXX76_006342 [Chlamydomonas incerta]
MRSALMAFESEVGYAAPARERAFFSALRTQLMEAAACREPEQRDMQLAAAYKWFSKHKPQGPEVDPITAAVLASSLSVEAAGDGRASQQGYGGPPQPPASMQQRLNAAHSSAVGTGGYGGAAAAAQAGPQGKHQFFGVFSGTTGAGGSGGGAGPGPSSAYLAGSARQGSARGPSPSAAGSRPVASSLSLNHPLVMHPTVAHGSAGAGAGAGPSARGGPAGPSGAGGGGPGRARFASTDMYAPGKLVRTQELDELDHRAAAAAAAADGGRGGGLMHAKPWLTGPFKSNAGTGSAAASRGAGAGKGGATAAEEEELVALREKWTAMDSKTSASVADVQAKVAEWTLQRARLEEEIVRRQEANRFAKPGAAGGGGAPWQQPPGMRRPGETDDHGLPAGTLSPYANANADLAAATAAAAASSATAPSSVSFMLPGGGGAAASNAAVAGANMRLRHAEVASYDRGRADLVARLAQLGLGVNSDTLDRALRPVEDRPFLDCISRLPKPGEHLPSRPGSVRLPAAKKKRSKSAGKARPKSGR